MGEAENRVAKRKSHTKSRKGCFSCKTRHTKCNEVRPRCQNCVRLDIHCNWPVIKNQYSASSPQSNGSSHLSPVVPEQLSAHSTAGSEPSDADLPIPDLRLLHHWMSKGHQSLRPYATSSREDNIWRDECINISFQHPPLLHGYLALSAVHKALTVPGSDRQSLLLQADSHISRGLAIYRQHLEAPAVERAVPMFMTSTVLFTYNLGSAQLEKPDDPIDGIHHCFRLLAGIKMVVMPFWFEIKDTSVFAHLVEFAEGDNTDSLDARAKDDSTPEMLALKELTGCLLNAQDRDTCLTETEELHRTSVRLRHLSARSDEYSLILGWAARLQDHFMHLVSAHNPVACIIIAYFAALLAQARPVWWVGNWPQWLLTACEQLLAATPELLKWLEWPRRIMSSQTPSTVSTPVSFE
ncbi:hypothetical protein C7974DRAFT_434033 [Boeremia exigua]|uniref:uncharacterized protein n=1 Tax=Boeremia exigua TaxID=749465 RepID=UPI001E8DEB8B|nr:uncharacterized protein C7974DRAFT_434033 [Boeremia exigua]KAH6629485.1 hypothetical protein C7974DRAFT_434033 [Boeremia exigua]